MYREGNFTLLCNCLVPTFVAEWEKERAMTQTKNISVVSMCQLAFTVCLEWIPLNQQLVSLSVNKGNHSECWALNTTALRCDVCKVRSVHRKSNASIINWKWWPDTERAEDMALMSGSYFMHPWRATLHCVIQINQSYYVRYFSIVLNPLYLYRMGNMVQNLTSTIGVPSLLPREKGSPWTLIRTTIEN